MGYENEKLFMMLVMVAAVMASVTCYAQISIADLNIGGIYYGQQWNDVINKLGAPVRRVRTPPAGTALVFRYGNNEIGVRGGEELPVRGVFIVSGTGSGLFTSREIGIGSTYDEVIKAYGKADTDTFITHPNAQNAQYHGLGYFVPNINPKEPGTRGYLHFSLSPDKIVTWIAFEVESENY